MPSMSLLTEAQETCNAANAVLAYALGEPRVTGELLWVVEDLQWAISDLRKAIQTRSRHQILDAKDEVLALTLTLQDLLIDDR